MSAKRRAVPGPAKRLLWAAVDSHQGEDLAAALAEAGWSVDRLVLASGESGRPARREMIETRFAGRRLWCELEVRESATGELWSLAMPDELLRSTAPALRRAAALALVGRELVRRASPAYDVIHAQGAEAALVLALLAADDAASPLRSLLGAWPLADLAAPAAELTALGFPAALADSRLGDEADEVSLLAAGLAAADGVLLESAPAVAAGAALGAGLAARSDAVVLPSGISPRRFDPANDPQLAAAFSAGRPGGKARCKGALQAELGLAARPKTPLVAFLGPLAPEAGAELVLAVAPVLLREWAQLVLVDGDAGPLEEKARAVAAEHPGRIACALDADDGLRRRALAGADLVVVPAAGAEAARTALCALRYGAVPLALGPGAPAALRAPRSANAGEDRANALLFHTATAGALQRALVRALAHYREAPRWRRLRDAALATDVSLGPAAERYAELAAELAVRPRHGVVVPERVSGETAQGHEPAPMAVPEAVAPPAAPFIDWGPPPPERYGEDVLTLLVQGPRSLYAFWEVSPATLARVGDDARLELHLVGGGEDHRLAGSVGDYGDWWVPARPANAYAVELRAPAGEVLLRSGAVETPREAAGSAAPARWVPRDRRRAGLIQTVSAAAPMPAPALPSGRRHAAAERARAATAAGSAVPPEGGPAAKDGGFAGSSAQSGRRGRRR